VEEVEFTIDGIAMSGYMSVFKNGKWTQIFGSRAKARRLAR
jgi:hypothetical protein